MVVVTQEFDEFALRLLKTRMQVAHQAERLRITHIAHGYTALLDHLIHSSLDLVTATVIANNDLKIAITLTHGTAQCALKKTRIEGRNDQADEGE